MAAETCEPGDFLEAVNTLDHAMYAFNGICDLVSNMDSADMHMVTPENLWFLLEAVRLRFVMARTLFD